MAWTWGGIPGLNRVKLWEAAGGAGVGLQAAEMVVQVINIRMEQRVGNKLF